MINSLLLRIKNISTDLFVSISDLMDFKQINYLLLYLKCDKTFDIRHIDQTKGFDEERLLDMRDGKIVRIETVYDDEPCEGVVLQAGDSQHLLRPAEDLCVLLKKKKWSLERIVSESGISREVFVGGPRQRLRNTGRIFTTDAETSDANSSTPVWGNKDQDISVSFN